MVPNGSIHARADGVLCPPDAVATCPTPYGPGAYNWEVYQPAARFWLFQGIEFGIYLALAALLLYFAIRRIRRIA